MGDGSDNEDDSDAMEFGFEEWEESDGDDIRGREEGNCSSDEGERGEEDAVESDDESDDAQDGGSSSENARDSGGGTDEAKGSDGGSDDVEDITMGPVGSDEEDGNAWERD
jgi:hypothetical protein